MHRLVYHGFDWDEYNLEKCRAHGVSVEEIESLFAQSVALEPDPFDREHRFRAIGRTAASRAVFLVFTLRERDGMQLIRPISARYMHPREVRRYETQNDPASEN